MRLRALVLGLLATVALAPAAIAADLGGAPARRGSLKDAAPPPMALYSWSGLYVGGHAGYGWSDIDWSSGATTFSDNGAGWLGGGQIGINWQRGVLVYGVEADISSGLDQAGACPFAGTCSHEVHWLASVRGRVGVTGNGNRTLLYATGGVAWADVEYRATGRFSDTHFGWVVGGGIEHMLTPRLSARVEYLYYAFDEATAPMGALSAGAVDLDPSFQTVRLGLNLKF
jgi:outer membrane immunogenic protein